MTDWHKVEAYYEQFDERGRLDTPPGRLEFQRALALLGSVSSQICAANCTWAVAGQGPIH